MAAPTRADTRRRLSLRKISLWVSLLTGIAMLVAVGLVALVSESVVSLAEQGGEDFARMRLEELRAVGNLERLVALGDQLLAERDAERQRDLAVTMQALALHPSVAALGATDPAVGKAFDVLAQMLVLFDSGDATQASGLRAGQVEQTHVRAVQLWSELRVGLGSALDRSAAAVVQAVGHSSDEISRGARLVLLITVVGTLLAGVIGLALIMLMRRQLLTPLVAISDYLVGLRKGVVADVRLPVARSEEVGEVVDAVLQLAAAQHALECAALRDPLTGLSNRYGLEARIEQSLNHARRMGLKLAVMFIDLDRFKAVNDSLGHANGDTLLCVTAKRFADCLRDADLVARLGGDEFVVVLSDLARAEDAVPVAEKLLDAAVLPVRIDGLEIQTTASIGVCVFPDDGTDVSTLMKHADTAMYQAKAAGRANFKFFDIAMNEAVSRRLHLENALRQALERNEFELHFQPQMDPSGRRVLAAEALLRWRRADGRLVPPLDFIPVAEESELICRIGDWVLGEACKCLGLWRARGAGDLRLAVNLSARQLRDPKLPLLVAELLRIHAVPAAALELEITESVAMQDPEASIRNLGALKRLGVSLAIDDFGTGYSSLAYLKLLPIDRLKLDRTFVRDLETDADDAAICAATVGLAHNLRLELIAEGVETHAQHVFLRNLGCDLLQGFHFHPPMNCVALAQLLELEQVRSA
ncbi:MAG TPA: EAL domain-containing protein [Rhodocyclaceae bacterium]|nr:EAL domain-containing protein [Rhodocyclaceae bacterium]